MTLLGIGMVLVFGFLAVRHFVNRRLIWGGFATIGMLLGLGSLTVDYLRVSQGAYEGGAYDASQRPAKNAWSKGI